MTQQTSSILFIGECMVELAPAGEPGMYTQGFAGDTFNTAWYLKQLRDDTGVGYYTRVGQDAMSQAMVDMIGGAGIDASHIGRSGNRSVGLYMISVKDGERSFSYWRSQSAARQLAESAEELDAAFAGADMLYFSGITYAILDQKGRETLTDRLAAARGQGKRIVFDPNLRPGLWNSTDEMVAGISRAAEVSDIVLPSFEDEATFFNDADVAATAKRYADSGASTVIVKNGADTIHYLHDGTEGQVSPPVAKTVVDTTAAGDSFNAGFLAGFDSGKPIEQVILNAAAVARQVIARKGALAQLDMTQLDI